MYIFVCILIWRHAKVCVSCKTSFEMPISQNHVWTEVIREACVNSVWIYSSASASIEFFAVITQGNCHQVEERFAGSGSFLRWKTWVCLISGGWIICANLPMLQIMRAQNFIPVFTKNFLSIIPSFLQLAGVCVHTGCAWQSLSGSDQSLLRNVQKLFWH